ncbi:lysophospholipid acyltransferase family protein [Prochlorothrix hollandica]|uniref:lysophospholipid acyltransferase family protein n=1 Tax=Prochlorothrix hollandica TaxID=1223 RepID=UPI000344AA0D|nr:1-acyl-sn-glycerol-3-phosphate acyltransferase [Prochlorothrix hollandica]
MPLSLSAWVAPQFRQQRQPPIPHPSPNPGICPWLAPVAYTVVHHWVLPFQFPTIKVMGQDNLPRSGAVLLTPTHRSRWDGLIIPYATGRWVTGRDAYFMVSANEMRGLQGWSVGRLGGFPVDTDRPGRSSVRRGVELLRQQQMLAVFPEGNIFQDGRVHPLKAGPAYMALQAANAENRDVQIVPIALHYSCATVSRGCTVTVKIDKPLSTQSYDRRQLKQATQALTADLEQRLVTLNDDVQGDLYQPTGH